MTKDTSGPAFIEPFGYFKCEPCGWTDCAETNDGAVPLYERATVMELKKQRDALLVALEGMLERYTGLVNSGDAGNWDAEKEDEVIASRAAIAKARGL